MNSHSSNKVLLVGLTEIVSSHARARGFIFEEATTGEEALEKARVTRFSRIILDIDVPGMDGIEATRKLREENPSVKIVLVSGLDRWNDCIQALEIEIEDIIMKPIDIRELLHLLGDSTSL